MLCNICKNEMKLVPAGISRKTNKPYNAFYSCAVCKKTATAITPVQKFEQGLDQDLQDEKWKKINAEKSANIAWLNAKNCASTILSGKTFDLKEFSALVRSIYLLEQ